MLDQVYWLKKIKNKTELPTKQQQRQHQQAGRLHTMLDAQCRTQPERESIRHSAPGSARSVPSLQCRFFFLSWKFSRDPEVLNKISIFPEILKIRDTYALCPQFQRWCAIIILFCAFGEILQGTLQVQWKPRPAEGDVPTSASLMDQARLHCRSCRKRYWLLQFRAVLFKVTDATLTRPTFNFEAPNGLKMLVY